MSSLLYRPTPADRSAALSGTPPALRSTVDLQGPTSYGSAAASPFSTSVDEIRTRLHDVVRSIDEVMSAAESVSPNKKSANATAAAAAAEAREQALEDLVRATEGRISSRDASLALLRARRASALLPSTPHPHEASPARPREDVARLASTTPLADSDLAQRRSASGQAASASLASSTAGTESGTAFSATYTAALDFWRHDGHRGLHGPPLPPPPPPPPPRGPPTLTDFTFPESHTESLQNAPMPTELSVGVAHVNGTERAATATAASMLRRATADLRHETSASTAAPASASRWPDAPAGIAAAGTSADTDTLTDPSVSSTRSSHTFSNTAAGTTRSPAAAVTAPAARTRLQADAAPLPVHGAAVGAAPLPTRAAATVSHSSSVTSNSGRGCRAPAALRALVDDSHFTASAPPPALAMPSPTAQTLSARLAALRDADAEQRRRLDADVHAILCATPGAAPGAGAVAGAAAHATTSHGDRLRSADDGCPYAGLYGRAAGAAGWHVPVEDAPHRLPPCSTRGPSGRAAANGFTSVFATTSPVRLAAETTPAAEPHTSSMLVRSPPTQPAMDAAAAAAASRSAERATRLGETSAVVALALQRQAALEAAWREAQEEATAPTRLRPPPAAPWTDAIDGVALTCSGALDQRRTPLHASGGALAVLSATTAPLDALQARLSPSTALTPWHASQRSSEGEALPMHAELAVRERLAERRTGQAAQGRRAWAASSAAEGQRYVRLSEARDREVAAHLYTKVARQTAVQAAAQARVEHLREALPDPPDIVTSAELGAIRVHAQQLERLRAQLHQQVAHSPLRAAPAAPLRAAAPAAGGAVRTAEQDTNSTSPPTSSLSIPVAAVHRAASGADTRDETTVPPAASARQAAAEPAAPTGRPPTSPSSYAAAAADLVVATASTRLRRADVAVDAWYDDIAAQVRDGVGHAATGVPSPQTRGADSVVERESTPEFTRPPGPATGLRWAAPRRRQRHAAAAAATNDIDVSSDSASERLTSTQLPPHLGTPRRGAQTPAEVFSDGAPSPSPVKPQAPSAGTAAVTSSRASLQRPARAAPTREAQPHLAVRPSHDVERDLISSSPSAGRTARAGHGGGGSLTPERLASIQSTSLHVSPQRGTAWQRPASSSPSSSSSSYAASAFSAATSALPSPRRPSRRASHRTQSPAPFVSAAPPSPRGRFVTPSHTTGAKGALRDEDRALVVERRAVQQEVNTRTALRAQAMLTELGIPVEVQLAGRRVPAMVQLSKDGGELLFHLDRVAQQRTTSLPTTPRASPPASSRASAASTAARQPRVVPPTQYPSPTPAAAPMRFQLPQNGTGAGLVRVPVGPSVQPHAQHAGPPAPPPGGMWVRRKVVTGRGGGGGGPLLSRPQFVQAPPGSSAAPPSSPPPPMSPSSVSRPVHVRELHHFPCALARVYVPCGVLGYERDLGMGGPHTWEDVSGVLCGPASFEVLRRYGCPLFAEVRVPTCTPYRVYLIIPEFQRIDIPQDAVLLVLDFKQRVDWVLFLLALQHNLVGRDTPERRGRPVLSYGRALWMLAAQRLHRARALRGANPFDSAAARQRTQRLAHELRNADGSGGNRLRRGGARAAAPASLLAPSQRRGTAATSHRDPAAVHGALDGAAAPGSARGRGGIPPHAGQGAVATAAAIAGTAPAPVALTARETSRPRFQLLRRVSRSLGRKSTSHA